MIGQTHKLPLTSRLLHDKISIDCFFFKAKILTGFLVEPHSSDTIRLTDICYLCDDQEYLRRFYKVMSHTKEPEISKRLTILANHYTSYRSIGGDYPTMILTGTTSILRRRNEKLHQLAKPPKIKNKDRSEVQGQSFDEFLLDLDKDIYASEISSEEPNENIFDTEDCHCIYPEVSRKRNFVDIDGQSRIELEFTEQEDYSSYIVTVIPLNQEQIVADHIAASESKYPKQSHDNFLSVWPPSSLSRQSSYEKSSSGWTKNVSTGPLLDAQLGQELANSRLSLKERAQMTLNKLKLTFQ